MRQILYLKIVFLIGKYTKKSPKREENFYESFKINIYYIKIRSDMCYFITVTD